MADVIVLDATNRAHVLFHATGGDHAAVVKIFGAEIEKLRAHFGADKIGLAFDVGESFRRQIEPTYKAGRPPTPGALKLALGQLIDLAAAKPDCVCLTAEGFEADDILATIAKTCVAEPDCRCVLVSPDKDLRQCLVAGAVTILREVKYKADRVLAVEFLTSAQCAAKFGVEPRQWADFQALVGDPTDGIKGWDGVGEKTAAQWLQWHTLDGLLANPFAVPLNVKQKRGRDDFVRRSAIARRLVRLRTDVPHVTDWF